MSNNFLKIANDKLRSNIRAAYLCDESNAVKGLIDNLDLSTELLNKISQHAIAIVKELRSAKSPGLMETFLAEYGLSTQEGVSLMCLAEALLRVPDDSTIDALINDKIAPANWSRHLGHSTSPLVNTSTWALMLTGKVIDSKETNNWDISGNIRLLLKRIGEPVIRTAVAQSMKILGHQFVLGRDIQEAMTRAHSMELKGYTYSYDMLGEGAHTAGDAQHYFMAYSKAISVLSENNRHSDITKNSEISVKLSALHPRYEFTNRDRVLKELVPCVASLVHLAKNANMGFNIDAEEADRLDLSLDIIEAVLSNPDLKGWHGLGVVVQTYSPRAPYVIDWLHQLASRLDRKIMVRLVKGAYWDAEIKLAQVEGLEAYPVFTRKASTDTCYMACAKKLLAMTDRIYPQFATHNAHTAAAILNMAGNRDDFEFQRLHGMGESLYEVIRSQNQSRCRIYAPVGIHEDLLAYLVRRLLENGANSSFVNQVLDESVPPEKVVGDPISIIKAKDQIANPRIPLPRFILSDGRYNSKGLNIANPSVLQELDIARSAFRKHKWLASAKLADGEKRGKKLHIYNPADHSDHVGDAFESTTQQVDETLIRAKSAANEWREFPVEHRASCLQRLANLYEQHSVELITLACREAGKSIPDAIGEVREAVDFCRYYAVTACKDFSNSSYRGRGVFICISPWNFPLAIFTGQIVAALVTGNSVIAKPAEQTPLIAARAVELMLEAGIPDNVIQLLPGDGPTVGARLTSSPLIDGICFTGSTETARAINKAMANHADPTAPLIAETGGLNAMIVDSTALAEQVVGDIVSSAFQSAGQRCSALRVLYLQIDIADKIINMLKGAMDELVIGNPWDLTTDVGPVIDDEALHTIEEHCKQLEKQGRLIKKVDIDNTACSGTFIAPAVYKIDSIEQLDNEIFGPILHIVTFESKDLEKVVDTINATGYGLTMGLHTRVDNRVQQICDKAHVGNLYINRNQIGAVVGVQPFGGEGLSGTGPKAGGPNYLYRFSRNVSLEARNQKTTSATDSTLNENITDQLQQTLTAAQLVQPDWNSRKDRRNILLKISKIASTSIQSSIISALKSSSTYDCSPLDLKGPTGEDNQLSLHGRGVFICTGTHTLQFAVLGLLTGNAVVILDKKPETLAFYKATVEYGLNEGVMTLLSSSLNIDSLAALNGLSGLAITSDQHDLMAIRQVLARRAGAILPLLTDPQDWRGFILERSLCIDTTASGGNATLLASADGIK
ncbi:MAG: bifunctional proline dehydrogenase/L-glutamate gamma-semialdehyde dehydrogenase PutA [Gammaproteobacteria bacterium]|jgi:RHH-type proline utilization regulon transcriptional repressor/proline dehydrogenase/delta 1-pyrroline-5-carboxylate dehydrogenase|nr:bifunctional proline dehydrogenase/L-glutamate gamma-semialdehyde dehydrogenase PutA [Gammaproteobacteria bacterium]MBT3723370.1 bifunctional proline dehydrogenase/L-glutamate gamma-semialdehyde dehydrogenase PutA [Gammaproteobacteria bacterium]MBT4193839.1 bifunctional proline dehydrogenase/L-glutamate gamma-semialdehyde dehydrogenase PutA [Gammaproteobacteria bacterium]MBT4449363.1 bifunctional proline dehydrogenase/L-glutamate gamma-semialdehyde dehydrogenase PutA [Gammaproteobacteria bact